MRQKASVAPEETAPPPSAPLWGMYPVEGRCGASSCCQSAGACGNPFTGHVLLPPLPPVCGMSAASAQGSQELMMIRATKYPFSLFPGQEQRTAEASSCLVKRQKA